MARLTQLALAFLPCRVFELHGHRVLPTYDKVVDASGTTLGYTKISVGPDGSIVHSKDKLLP